MRDLCTRPAHIVLFTNIPAPYRIPALNAMAQIAGENFSVIFAAPGEERRSWKLDPKAMRFPWTVLSKSTGEHGPLAAMKCAAKIWSMLSQRPPSAVICGGYGTLACWAMFCWCKLFRRRFVLWLDSHGRSARSHVRLRPLRTAIKRLIVSNADAIAVAGRASAAYARGLGAADERIFIAPFGTDYGAFAREAAQVSVAREKSVRGLPARLVLYAGRLVEEKGVFVLLEAFRQIACELPDAGLLIAGHGPEEPAMRQFCRRANLGGVFFEGPQDYGRMPFYFALADVLALPTFRDAWGFVVNEAFACGVPAVISRVAGAYDDLIIEGETGFGVEHGNAAELAAALLRVLRDRPLRARMSASCRRKIEAWSAEACAVALTSAANWQSPHLFAGLAQTF